MDTPTPDQAERRALRKQLRQAGWNIGTTTRTTSGVVVELWPVPHTGPGEGVAPRRVTGRDKTDALRNALLDADERLPAAEETT